MRRKILCLLTLLILLTPILVTPITQSKASGAQNAAWVDQSYKFRRQVVISNQGANSLTNWPVTIHLAFAKSEVSDLTGGLEVLQAVGSNMSSVDSFVLDQTFSSGFVTSATIAFLANINSSTSASFEIYYGKVSTQFPSYRQFLSTNGFSQGTISFKPASGPPGTDGVELSLGSTYAETFLSKLDYSGLSMADMGSSQISRALYGNETGWRLVGNASSNSLLIASNAMDAGSIRVSRTLFVYPDRVLGETMISNQGKSPLNGVELTQLINASEPLSITGIRSSIQLSSGLFMTSAGGSYIGYRMSMTPSAYDTGPIANLTNEAKVGLFLSRTESSGASGGLFRWNFGIVNPGAARALAFGWAVSSSAQQVEILTSIPGSSAAVTLGLEQVFNSFSPLAIAAWGSTISLANQSIGTRGLSIPLSENNGSLLAATARVGGTFSYIGPSASFSPGSRSWSSSSGNGGNASGTANPALYSLDRGGYMGSLILRSPNVNGSAFANLVSETFDVFGDTSPVLDITYQASFNTVSGLPSSQQFYIAVDLSGNYSGRSSQTLFIPVAGTSSVANSTSCGQSKLAVFSRGTATQISQPASLVADGTWRTLSLNLKQWTDPGGFQASLRVCQAESKSFVGNMQLGLVSTGISAKGPAANLLTVSLPYAHPQAQVSFLNSVPSQLPPVVWDAYVYFTSVSQDQMSLLGGTSFEGKVTWPQVSTNITGRSTITKFLTLSLEGVSVQTNFAPIAMSIILNGTGFEFASTNGTVYTTHKPSLLQPPPHLRDGPTPVSIVLSLGAGKIDTKILDTNGNPVPKAIVDFQVGGSSVVSQATNSSGVSTVALLPWNYSIIVTFESHRVGGTNLTVTQGHPISIRTNVYEISVATTDILNKAIPGAEYGVSTGTTTIKGVAGSDGFFHLQAAGDQVYSIVVSVGGVQIYDGVIKAAPNNAIIKIVTGYFPTYLTLSILVAVVVAIICVSIAYLSFRK